MEQMQQYTSGIGPVLYLIYWQLMLQHCSPYSVFSQRQCTKQSYCIEIFKTKIKREVKKA